MKYYLDVDLAISRYNENKRPEDPEMSRELLSELTGIHYQSLVNYKAENVPAIVPKMIALSKLCVTPLEQLVKPKK